jgi:hypothetical protein
MHSSTSPPSTPAYQATADTSATSIHLSIPTVTPRARRPGIHHPIDPHPEWVPQSLRTFRLAQASTTPSTPVPLTPVKPDPNEGEERDSFDEHIGERPYHRSDWNGRLPGPGFGRGFGTGIGAETYEGGAVGGGRMVLI